MNWPYPGSESQTEEEIAREVGRRQFEYEQWKKANQSKSVKDSE